ncbi:MAG: DUF2100 domain-containing protein [Candidatus Lokiarchaeota archaeon]|nr:DUF2100 domain-containing protein [Candidatus Lokiarchaeota archaeon]
MIYNSSWKKINSEEVKALLNAINSLIEIKILIRNTAPNFEFDDIQNEKFIELLKSLYNKLKPIFSKYLKDENSVFTTTTLRDNILKTLNSNNFALISANSSKKKLKNIGIDPRRLIVSGGPLFFEDYMVLNPDIKNEQLQSIKKKCDRLINKIKNETWDEKDLVFIYEKGNFTDKFILDKINRLSELIGKQVKVLEIKSWKDLN